MTETLPESAPSDGAAAPSVEEQVPASEVAVVTESAPADGDKTVPAARFNGLMGKMAQVQNELEAARQVIAELQAATPATEEPVTDTSALEAQVAAMSKMLMEERLENARKQAIADFPGAKDFADLIVADTPEDVRAMAQLLHERVQGRTAGEASPTGEASEGTPTPTETAPVVPESAPVVAGGTVVTGAQGEASPEERIAAAIKAKDFPALLQAKHDLAVGSELVL